MKLVAESSFRRVSHELSNTVFTGALFTLSSLGLHFRRMNRVVAVKEDRMLFWVILVIYIGGGFYFILGGLSILGGVSRRLTLARPV